MLSAPTNLEGVGWGGVGRRLKKEGIYVDI